MTRTKSFSQGFSRGNYGNAYESTDWDSWYANNCTGDAEAREGMILGFFSSYEIDEIPDPEIAETVRVLRNKYGEEE